MTRYALRSRFVTGRRTAVSYEVFSLDSGKVESSWDDSFEAYSRVSELNRQVAISGRPTHKQEVNRAKL